MEVMTFDNLPIVEKVEVLVSKIPIWVWFVIPIVLLIGIYFWYQSAENNKKANQLANDKAKLEKEREALIQQVSLYEERYKLNLKG